MRKLIAALLFLIAAPLSADWSFGKGISVTFGDARYCQLAGCTMTGVMLAPNGTSSAPSYSFSNFPTIGLYANTNLALAQGTGTLLVTGTTAVPSALTTALVVAAGNIDFCSHSYQATFVTAGGETSAGTTSNAVTNDVTHAQNSLASVPLGNIYTTQRKIYRNTCAAPTVYKLQQTIANNTATTGVQDNTADSGLGAVIPASNTAIDTRWTMDNSGGATFTGAITLGAGSFLANTAKLYTDAAAGAVFTASNGTTSDLTIAGRAGAVQFAIPANTSDAAIVPAGGNLKLGNAAQIGFSSGDSRTTALDLIITRPAAATLQLGAADVNGAPVAQTIRFQGVTGATNGAGADATVKCGGPGTGTAVGAKCVVQVATPQASGTTQAVFNTIETFQDFGLANVPRPVITTGSSVFQESIGNTKFVTADFTTASASFVTITGLSFTMPATHAMSVPFRCEILYSQATAAVANQFGIQDVTVAPTSLMAKATVWTSASVAVNANVPALTTTTATSIITFTPSAITTIWNANIAGFIEQPSNAAESVINILVLTGNASDSITVKRGSHCTIGS